MKGGNKMCATDFVYIVIDVNRVLMAPEKTQISKRILKKVIIDFFWGVKSRHKEYYLDQMS